jgi:hypothetical protein
MTDAIIKALPDYDAQQARIKELEANINVKADWIDRTMSDMGADAQKIKELEMALLVADAAYDAGYDDEWLDSYIRKRNGETT